MNDARHLKLNFADTDALYVAYMPFLRNGGLFSATAAEYKLGDEVRIALRLPDDPESFVVAGHVVWITPETTQGQRPAGIGIQFEARDCTEARRRIEDQLAGVLGGDRSTHTM